jgi:hypothetical protein
MATITSSTIVSDRPQASGCRYIGERHVDSTGAIHEFDYTAQANTDANAVMATRAAALPAMLAAAEMEANLTEIESET